MRFPWFRSEKSTKPEDRGVEARLKALEDRWDVIETEWNDWYEKFRLLHLRLARRQKAIEAAEATETPEKASQPNGGTDSVDSPAGFTDHQREMQQKILRQRARM